ncbi:MAG: hypothetical protein MZU91_13375 [Desulfosudis oleivorans]|nr:hypothetical protein [Desulfosudis oleivorans]
MDKAYGIDPDQTKKTILQTFVFKKVGGGRKSRISIEEASSLLEIPEHQPYSQLARSPTGFP